MKPTKHVDSKHSKPFKTFHPSDLSFPVSESQVVSLAKRSCQLLRYPRSKCRFAVGQLGTSILTKGRHIRHNHDQRCGYSMLLLVLVHECVDVGINRVQYMYTAYTYIHTHIYIYTHVIIRIYIYYCIIRVHYT